MIEDEHLIARLHAFASAPVDDEVAAQHAELMGSVAPAPVRHRTRALVAGGTLVAAMFAGTGIAAAAGSLPGPAQKVAHSALAKVGVDVPKERSTEGCNGKTYKNHGQFMKDQPKGGEARSAAAKSKCGKPVNDDDGTEDEATTQNENENGVTGKDTAPGQTGDAGKSGEDHGNAPDNAGKPDDPGRPETTPPVDAPVPDAPNDAGKSGGKGKSGR